MSSGGTGRRLSLPMIRALRQIREQPGHAPNEYEHVGLGTIRALERRRLIAIERHGKTGAWLRTWVTQAGNDLHLHVFRTTMHLDGCHWYQTAAVCECGATYAAYGERDVKGDPYSTIWMEPAGEDGKECERCHELLAGARPIYRESIEEPRRKVAA